MRTVGVVALLGVLAVVSTPCHSQLSSGSDEWGVPPRQRLVSNTELTQQSALELASRGHPHFVDKPIPTAASTPFFEAVRRKHAYAQGRLGARYGQFMNLTVGNHAFVEGQLLSRANITVGTLAGDRLSAEDVTVRIIHAPPNTNQIMLHSRLQVDGQVLYAAQNIDETLQHIQANLDASESSVFSVAGSNGLNPAAPARPAEQTGPATQRTAFLQTLSVPSHSGNMDRFLRQWAEVQRDHFDEGSSGWLWTDTEKSPGVSHCGSGDQFLTAGLCQSGDPHGHGVFKVYALPHQPGHTRLMLTARVHFVDSWQRATAFAMLDGEYVWVETHGYDHEHERADPHVQASSCGSTTVQDRMSVPIRVVIPHTASTVNVTFGSTGPCTGSFGIDDVSLSLQ